MPKDPAFLFYPNDYLGGTMGFSFEMHGAYLTMLLYQFNNGPFSDDAAISIIGKLWDLIQHKFKRKNGSGLRYNEKMESVIEQRQNFLTSRRDSALKRWNKNDKPLSKKKIDTMRTQSVRNANAMRSGNGNGNENTIEDREENFKTEVNVFIEYSESMRNDFIRYWTEKNKSMKKMRFEMQETFEIKKRLVTWNKNNFGNKSIQNKIDVSDPSHRQMN